MSVLLRIGDILHFAIVEGWFIFLDGYQLLRSSHGSRLIQITLCSHFLKLNIMQLTSEQQVKHISSVISVTLNYHIAVLLCGTVNALLSRVPSHGPFQLTFFIP